MHRLATIGFLLASTWGDGKRRLPSPLLVLGPAGYHSARPTPPIRATPCPRDAVVKATRADARRAPLNKPLQAVLDLLDLEPIEVNLFRGQSPKEEPQGTPANRFSDHLCMRCGLRMDSQKK